MSSLSFPKVQVGVNHARSANAIAHQFVQRLQQIGCGDRDVLFALAAGVLFAMMLDHFPRRRNELRLLADVAADFPAERAAAGAGAFFVGQFVNHLPAGKALGPPKPMCLLPVPPDVRSACGV